MAMGKARPIVFWEETHRSSRETPHQLICLMSSVLIPTGFKVLEKGATSLQGGGELSLEN